MNSIYYRYTCDKCRYEGLTPCPHHHNNEVFCSNPREKYHLMLDEAMNETKEGDFFITAFMDKILRDAIKLTNNHNNY